MAGERFFKAVRPSGGSFHDPEFKWALEPGGVTTHPDFRAGRGPRGYLSVSTVSTDCTGFEWPCRLFEVEAVEGHPVFAPEVDALPSKRASGAFRTVRELPAHEVFGPQGEAVAELIESAGRLTTAQAQALYAAGHAARATARDAAGATAGYAAGYAAWHAARDAARDAAGALTFRDLIGTGDWTREAYDILAGPWVSVMGKLHPDD